MAKKKKRVKKPIKPEIKSFLIADKVIQEKHTNKWSAIGIFDRIFVKKFPSIHKDLALYIRLSDAEGVYKLRVEFTYQDEKVLSRFEGIEITIPSRLAFPDFGINTQNLPLPKPGKYYFRLILNDEFIQQIPLDVISIGAIKS